MEQRFLKPRVANSTLPRPPSMRDECHAVPEKFVMIDSRLGDNERDQFRFATIKNARTLRLALIE